MEYTERLELPDGQWAVLLTRLPYERAHKLRTQVTHDPTLIQFTDGCVRAFLWEASLKDGLTGEEIDASEFERAADEVVSKIGARVLALHHEWRKVAYPAAPKVKGRKASEPSANESSSD